MNALILKEISYNNIKSHDKYLHLKYFFKLKLLQIPIIFESEYQAYLTSKLCKTNIHSARFQKEKKYIYIFFH